MDEYTTPGANETEWPTLQIEARSLKLGDFLPASGEFVDSKSNGSTYTHVVARSGKKLKFRMTEELEIEREQLTEAAKKIRNREYARKALIKLLDKHRDHEAEIVKALEEAVKEVTGEKRYGLGRQLDYLMDVAVLRARADLWRRVLWMFEAEESKTRGDAIATFLKAQEIFTRDLVESGRYSSGPLSRSSSMTSNLAEDLERHERVKFLDDIKWELHALDNA